MILVSLVCFALLATGSIEGEGRAASRARVGLFVAIPAGIATAGYELVAWRRAKRAVAVMRSREPG